MKVEVTEKELKKFPDLEVTFKLTPEEVASIYSAVTVVYNYAGNNSTIGNLLKELSLALEAYRPSSYPRNALNQMLMKLVQDAS